MNAARIVRRLLPAAVLAAGAAWGPLRNQWSVYENCTLVENPFNDGDSFHVKTGKARYLFRLYFVDAPETDPSLQDRLQEQAAYWGTDTKSVLALGKKAAQFTAGFLSKGFTVCTRKEDARGRSEEKRYFAVVKVGERYLSDALVEAGLARVYGGHVDLPDGTSERKYFAKLRALERTAQRARAGGWGLPKSGRVGR
jgi:endonuclease YncB( thermonuclease family)